MKALSLLLLIAFTQTMPDVPFGDSKPSETAAVRVERFLQLWSACDSMTEVYRNSTAALSEVAIRHQRYVLALYWRAELEAYAALADTERTIVWPLAAPGIATPRLHGELLHQEIRERFLPATPAVSRRIATLLHTGLRDDLIGRGLDAAFVRVAAQLWPPSLYFQRHRIQTVVFFY